VVITESIGFSIQITHSLLLVLFSVDGLAVPQERHTTREPKFVSGQDEHFQSPGLDVTAGGTSISIGSRFGRLHL
jgi:hypothetical protein